MKTSSQDKELRKYTFDGKEVYTGFASFNDAENFANNHNGNLVEVAFKDGNDNPQITSEAGLVDKKLHYFVDAGSEYQFIHSADPSFRDYADQLQEIKSELEQNSPEEKYLSNAELEISEDPIIVLKNGNFESVTSRERSKYLKQAHVYEIGVSINN